jgi:hypothetical protein
MLLAFPDSVAVMFFDVNSVHIGVLQVIGGLRSYVGSGVLEIGTCRFRPGILILLRQAMLAEG